MNDPSHHLETALYVVATPIGNLGDMAPRACSVLASADAIYAEDTRHSQNMFRQLGLSVSVRSLHQHNERSRTDEIVEQVRAGGAVAIVSDAGTPLISDPGARVVDAMHNAGLAVRSVPGPSAVTAALSISGLAGDSFRFCGFLPSKPGQRDRALADLSKVTETLVLFEAPHRLLASLRSICEHFGPTRRASLVRELSKRFETVRRDELCKLVTWVADDDNQRRGEIVLVLEGFRKHAQAGESVGREDLLAVLAAELPPRAAARIAARMFGGDNNAWYREILSHKK